jgi:MFS family permease
MKSVPTSKANIKQSTAKVLFVASAFVWYLIAFYSLKITLNQQSASDANTLFILGVNTGAIALAGLIGTFVVGKMVDHKRFLLWWIASGIILSLAPIVIDVTNLTGLTVLSIIFGAYFGLGMPATMGYFSRLTKVDGRAKIGGITVLMLGIGIGMTSLIIEASPLVISAILASIRIIGLVAFRIISLEKLEQTQVEKKITFVNILSNRSFILYFIPWLMFALINWMTIPIQQSIYPSQDTYTFLAQIDAFVTAVVALISGIAADKIGRKRFSIIGFVMLGIGYASIGLASVISFSTAESVNLATSGNLLIGSIIFTITDGIAWGIFYVLFLFTLWGDLAINVRSDKFYYMGVLPYVSAYFMQLLFTPLLSAISSVTVFSFASVFLFIAVLPLIYAPETLPEKLMKDRDLKSYIENAKKKAAKIEQKIPPPQEEKAEPSENIADYEEAKKLAEKYY